ncbi:MAG: hypothetical protein ACK4OP_15185, partial [Gemmobacter sp.]
MAFVFDYSGSRLGINGGATRDDLGFGQFYGAFARAAEYWGFGAAVRSFTVIDTDTSVFPARDVTVTGRVAVDSFGALQVVYGRSRFNPIENAAAHRNDAPQAFFDAEGRLVLSDIIAGYGAGSFLTFAGLDAPSLDLDAVAALPPVYPDTDVLFGIARDTMDIFRADLLRLAETPLADAGAMTIQGWNSRPKRGDDFVLVMTATGPTDKTVGDVLDFNSEGSSPGYGQVRGFSGLVRGEDVEIIGTRQADTLYLDAFPARRLDVALGAGDDRLY